MRVMGRRRACENIWARAGSAMERPSHDRRRRQSRHEMKLANTKLPARGQAPWGLGWRSIQDVPNLSLSIAKRDAKNVSCIGMKI